MLAEEKVYTLITANSQADQFRLAALHRYHILDTPACEDFSFLTELAAKICEAPYAFISLVDAERVWIKSCAGMQMGELPRGESYCALAVLGDAATEIPDLTLDPRTAHMPLTVGEPHMRMYSSVALTSSDGFAIGTLCVLDIKPGRLSDDKRAMLGKLARQVMALIELRANEKTLEATVRELELLATTDELTGLHNRRSLLHRLKFEVARARRFRSPLSAVMIDLDHFKKINDDHGHAVGDQVLTTLGKLLRENVRVIDVPGRYGGEELCVILPNTPLEGACKFAETLRAKIEAQIHYASGRPLHVTASLGIGVFDHMDVNDIESLLRQADAALYRAKHGGRNRVECGT
ncbi:sensor domain-containing diguanylate cyclase [Duganella sp. sic0402]|uniref:sensor domain-containing diguanylate cyclase n=1 Tax=Duganella sp. sic0402 TaxID=2854786 RepID=UPI001C48170E|nr:sensor domain-containing diguanylate cyclase [Duganella sp. sic0402]MBV7537452.1 sensor domain-containing diguanylate cyclase [Duganella sp. sic0402]